MEIDQTTPTGSTGKTNEVSAKATPDPAAAKATTRPKRPSTIAHPSKATHGMGFKPTGDAHPEEGSEAPKPCTACCVVQ